MSQSQPAAPRAGAETRYVRSDRVAQRRNRVVRLVVLAVGLVAITGIGIAHQRGVNVVGADALCPFGGIESLWSLIISAKFLQRIALSSVILLGAVVGIAVVFRRSFCGYICPLGAVQEFFAKAGSLVWRGKRPVVPAAIDRPARYLKYAVLVGFTLWTWQAATLVLRPYDPWVAYMHLTSAELLAEFSVGLAVLGMTVVGSVVYDRFFCKYLCPMGAFLGAISRFSLFKVRRNADTCIDCKSCDKACPVNVVVSDVVVVQSAECINCNECVNVCPVNNTLEVSTRAWPPAGKVLQPLAVLGAVAALIVALVGVTTATGAFAWAPPSLTQSVEKSGGVFNVEDIRGSMTFAEVSKATGIPESAFEQRFGVTRAEMETPMKELAEPNGFDVHTDVRGFVEQQLQLGGGRQ